MYDYEEAQIEALEKKNQELRDLCEKMLKEIKKHRARYKHNGKGYCHYCNEEHRDMSLYSYNCKPDCITNTKIPD